MGGLGYFFFVVIILVFGVEVDGERGVVKRCAGVIWKFWVGRDRRVWFKGRRRIGFGIILFFWSFFIFVEFIFSFYLGFILLWDR